MCCAHAQTDLSHGDLESWTVHLPCQVVALVLRHRTRREQVVFVGDQHHGHVRPTELEQNLLGRTEIIYNT